jgi:imidazole glycerol-phosphate synthase subunit HisH
MITIVNAGSGNIQSVQNAFFKLNIPTIITANYQEIQQAKKLVFPGVGNFGYVMENLLKSNLLDLLKEKIGNGTYFLGICIGMQILFQKSEESPSCNGLNLLNGEIKQFRRIKIPQIGWNKIEPIKDSEGILKEGYAYYVNSYYVQPKNLDIIVAKSKYSEIFPAAISYKNILAVQFHPEKSGKYGLQFLKRWASC